MEQRDRFDEAIKAKIGALEGDPSDVVWRGLSAAIGATTPQQAATWRIKFAAAAAFVAVVGLGYWYLQVGQSMPRALALNEKAKTPRAVVAPQDYFVRHGAYPVQSRDGSAGEPAPSHGLSPLEDATLLAHAVRHASLPARDSPGSILKTAFGQAPDPDQPIKALANLETLVADTSPRPALDRGGWSPDTPGDARREEGKAIASNLRRRIPIPGREDLGADQLWRRPGAVLRFVTNGANQFLGLDASYSERQAEDLKLTAFHADLGVFKIRKVKTVKQ
jgi:hypothetical protein